MRQDRFDHLFIAPGQFDASLAFYRETLGWQAVQQWGGQGQPRGCLLDGGGVQLVIAEPHDTVDHAWTHGANGHRPTLHLRVDDLDARFAQIDPATVVLPPEATHWGTRWFIVRDPDANLIAFEAPSDQPDSSR
jgi:catechol 2,3-dioxygenase-like lactoylglutathione lyase family enzyme